MSQEIQQVELSIEEAKRMVALKNKVEKLSSNREFRAVVEDGYFRDEAVRLTQLAGDFGMAAHREEIFLEMQAISKFRSFLSRLMLLGNTAEAELLEAEIVLDELREQEGTA